MINIAIIGYGYWGAKIHAAFSKISRCRIVAAADINEGRLRSLELVTASNYKKILENPQIHAVAIATPADTHYEIARAAMEAGKDCFVEKPFTLDHTQALILEETARHSKRIVMVDHLLLYHPAVIELIRSVRAGHIGDLCSIRAQRIGGKVRETESVLWSLGPHDLSLVLELINEPLAELHARGRSYLKGHPKVEDTAFVHLSFGKGIMVDIHLSWMEKYKERRFTIVGTEGAVEFNGLDGSCPLTFWPSRGVPELSTTMPLERACRHFVSCVQTGMQPLTNAASGANVVRMLQHIDLSIKGTLW